MFYPLEGFPNGTRNIELVRCDAVSSPRGECHTRTNHSGRWLTMQMFEVDERLRSVHAAWACGLFIPCLKAGVSKAYLR
jgi:hypothetical protein